MLKKNNAKIKPQKNRMTKGFHSIIGYVQGMILISTSVAIIIVLLISSAKFMEALDSQTKEDMMDLTESYGEKLDGVSVWFLNESSSLANIASKMHTSASESSYVYIVGADGLILYHPDSSKVGQPVANDVVKGFAASVQAGKIPDDQIIQYSYDGSEKYAACYFSKINSKPFILILTAEKNEIMAPLRNTIFVAVATGIIICILSILIASMMIKKQLQGMKELTDNLTEISDNNLMVSVNPVHMKKKNEIGLIAIAEDKLLKSLTEFAHKLASAGGNVISSTESLTASADTMADTATQVNKAVSEIASGATSQSIETQGAADKIDMIGQMIGKTADSVKLLNDSQENMKQTKLRADAVLKQLEESNNDTRSSVMEISESTKKTNDSVNEIQKAASFISDIAEQTNLLSLNASIEAARAGESGKGFAVVAESIGKLAEQSEANVKKIEDIMVGLVTDSSYSIETMKIVQEMINKQSEAISETNDAFEEISNEIISSSDIINEISNGTHEISDAKNKIVDGVQSLTAISEQNAASTEECSASMEELNKISIKVNDSTTELKNIAQEIKDIASQLRC